MALVELRDIRKTYHLGGEVIHALDGVNLDVDQGDFTSIIGPSGSGKSTLMHILGCLDTPSSGSMNLDGMDIHNATPRQLAKVRGEKIGFVFLMGSGLKFLLFFLLLYPAFNADGELSSMEFASFFIPYTLTTVVENVVLVRQLSRS